MTPPLRMEDFTPHVGKAFRFPGWHGTLRLARVEPAGAHATPPGGRAPFILIFQGPSALVLPDGLYDATTDDGASFHFQIMPIHTVAADRQDYQAVFN